MNTEVFNFDIFSPAIKTLVKRNHKARPKGMFSDIFKRSIHKIPFLFKRSINFPYN